MDGRGRTGKIIDLIDFNGKGITDIVTKQFEVRMIYEREQIGAVARLKIVYTEYFVLFFQKALAEVGA